MSYDITFCPNKECTKKECHRHYIHIKEIPTGNLYSIFAEKPNEKDCPHYWEWHYEPNSKPLTEKEKEKRRKYNTEYQRKRRARLKESGV